MTFYTPQGALDWLKGQVSALFAARGVLQDAYGRALLAQQKSMGTLNATRATQLVADLRTSLGDQTSLENKIKTILPESLLPQQLGIFPLLIGAGAIAVAGAVYLHLQRVGEYQQTLSLVEKGVLTPAQAVALQSGGGLLSGISGLTGNLGTLAMFAVGGYALFLFGPMLSRMLGGRKS